MSQSQMLDSVVSAIHAARRIALVSHVSPDGDALGSALALKLGLEQMGKTADVFCQDPVPGYLMFMPGAREYRLPESAEQETFDLLLAVDVADLRRMGSCEMLIDRCSQTAQVDHHSTNPRYTQANCVDENAPASGEIIWALLKALGVQLTIDMAVCIYTAISTDTGNLAYGHLTEETFRTVGEMVAMGLDVNELNRMLFRQRETAAVRLLGRALSTLTFHDEKKITSMQITREDFLQCGAGPEHADMIVNYGLDILGVRMAVLARETERPGEVKLSLRAVKPDQVSSVAAAFGGGGHPQAAGATVRDELAHAVTACVLEMKKALHGDV